MPGVDAISLSGGSAFGLDTPSGVQAWLREQGRGFAIASARVPIVPAAILYDLGFGGEVYVAGLTLAQAERAIARKLASDAKQAGRTPDDPIEVAVRLVSGDQDRVFRFSAPQPGGVVGVQ